MQKICFQFGPQDKRDPGITTDDLEHFFKAIEDSPQLYPYFMKIFPDGLWRLCTKMASYITRVSNKNIITPADTEFLKKIHHGLGIDEATYDEFTRLFAHVCCRNKSDSRRKKMLSIFSLLKEHICPSAGREKNFAAFCGVVLNLDPKEWKQEADSEPTCWLDSFPEPSSCFRSIHEIPRSEVWNEPAHCFHLKKRLRRCEKLIRVIQNNSERMEMRISKLEEESKSEQFIMKRKRDLDLVGISCI